MDVLWQILFLALAVSAISTTISLSSLFAPLRRWCRRRSKWLARLVSCAYCSSHWVAFIAVAWYHPRVMGGWWLADWVVVVFAVVAIANLVTGVVRKLNYFEADPWNYIRDRSLDPQVQAPEGAAHTD